MPLLHPVVLDGVAAMRRDVLQEVVQRVAVADPDRDDRDIRADLAAVAAARDQLEPLAGALFALLARDDRGKHLAERLLCVGRREVLAEVFAEDFVGRPAEAAHRGAVPAADLALLVHREVAAVEQAQDHVLVALELLGGDAERGLG